MLVTPSYMYLKSEMFGEMVINMFNGDADKYMLVHIKPRMRLQQKNGKESVYRRV